MEELLPDMNEPAEAGSASTTGSPGTQRVEADVSRSGSMKMLLNFELPVRISLARTSLALKDLLKLSTGSVLELNRSLDDLADIVVNGRVIAQGEIVVVEGNYGIRIRRINDQARDAASHPERRD
jgi:flagellar motor switch protein FliN/FliY